MTPRGNPIGRSGAVALTVLVLWLIARLWPLWPDAEPAAGQARGAAAVHARTCTGPSSPRYFVGWLVVAQAVFHLAQRQRSVDAFLLVIAVVLVGRTFTAGNTLVFAELAAIALLLPVLVLLSRVEDRGRSALIAAVARHAGSRRCAAAGARQRAPRSRLEMPAAAEFLSRSRRRPRSSPARASATSRWRGCWPARGCIRTSRRG